MTVYYQYFGRVSTNRRTTKSLDLDHDHHDEYHSYDSNLDDSSGKQIQLLSYDSFVLILMATMLVPIVMKASVVNNLIVAFESLVRYSF